MTIGMLGRVTDTKVETIRYYEKIGLLPLPIRSGDNYRSYGAAELGRLAFRRIKSVLCLSFPMIKGATAPRLMPSLAAIWPRWTGRSPT